MKFLFCPFSLKSWTTTPFVKDALKCRTFATTELLSRHMNACLGQKLFMEKEDIVGPECILMLKTAWKLPPTKQKQPNWNKNINGRRHLELPFCLCVGEYQYETYSDASAGLTIHIKNSLSEFESEIGSIVFFKFFALISNSRWQSTTRPLKLLYLQNKLSLL